MIWVLAALYEALTSYWYTILATILGYCRIVGYKSKTFQAIAHLFVGGLFLFSCVYNSKVGWATFLVITLIELYCFLRDKGNNVTT